MKIVKSKDGTYTAYNEEFDECYHNVNDGALKESLKKHVEPAFFYLNSDKKEVTILDICFGLGYNTFATIYFLKKSGFEKRVHIISPELDEKVVKSLADFKYPKEFEPFKDIIKKISQNLVYEDEKLKIEVKIGDARDIVKNIDKKIDVVYQDPFSPKKNPALWTIEYFKDISNLIDYNGILTTYSIATPVRLALYEVGFRVYEREIEGVKRQTVASKKDLPLKEIDMQIKKRRSNSKPLSDKDVKKI